MEQQPTTPWGKIAVLALGAFVIGADGFMLAAVLPQVAQQLGVSLGQTGFLVTVFAWVYALAAPLYGMLMGRRNRRSTLVLALAIFAIGNGVAALASSFVWMMVARVMAALGSAMMMPTAMALATSLAPAKHRGKAISVVTTGMTMATVLAVPLGSVVGERYGYHMLFWAMAVAAVLVLCGIGAIGNANQIFDTYTMVAFGLMAYLMIKAKIPTVPMILGFILGPTFEQNLRRASQLTSSDPFWNHPIFCVLIVATLLVVVFSARANMRDAAREEATQGDD